MRLKAKTEEFLYFLLWNAETLASPSWRNATTTFEGWAWRNGLIQRITRLEKQKYLEQRKLGMDHRLIRLTETGRLMALGGRDPQREWDRPWDGQWRLVIFDLPQDEEGRRTELRRVLVKNHFGILQRSVWVTPHRLDTLRTAVGKDDQVGTFFLLEGHPCGGEPDTAVVQAAWDFQRINARYAAYLAVLDSLPDRTQIKESRGASLHRWAEREHQAWKRAVQPDPLLPLPLLPKGYLGRKAWEKRNKTLLEAGRLLDAPLFEK